MSGVLTVCKLWTFSWRNPNQAIGESAALEEFHPRVWKDGLRNGNGPLVNLIKRGLMIQDWYMVASCPTDIIFTIAFVKEDSRFVPVIHQYSYRLAWNRPTQNNVVFLLDDPAVQGLDKSRHLQTGEMIIIVVVLVMWAGRFQLCVNWMKWQLLRLKRANPSSLLAIQEYFKKLPNKLKYNLTCPEDLQYLSSASGRQTNGARQKAAFRF